MDDRMHRRLVRAELRLRWLGWMSMTLVLVNVTLMLTLILGRFAPAQSAGVIALRDDSGHERIRLDASGPEPFLSMLNAHGSERLRLALRVEDASLLMLDPEGRVRLALVVESQGGGISLFDEHENVRSEMRVEKSAPDF